MPDSQFAPLVTAMRPRRLCDPPGARIEKSDLPAAPAWTERSIDLPGRGEIFVRESAGPAGAPVLLLLHGLGATGLLNWRSSLDPLARVYRVLVVDHRGHGRGIRIKQPFRLVDCADDCAALLDVLEIDQVIAVGYSMGGAIAQLLWKRHPERVAGLVLCATAYRFGSQFRRRLAFAVGPLVNSAGRIAPRRFLRRMARRSIGDLIEDDEVRSEILSEIYASDPVAIGQAAAAILRFNASGWIPDIDVPTSVVLTELDQLVRPKNQRKLGDRIRGAEIHGIAGDHAVCGMDPDRFVPALLAACASVAARAAERPGPRA